ncbi:TIR domain-containing protein [Spirosoma arcticum]
MATRKAKNSDTPEHTKLIISKEEFKTKLEKCIARGQELVGITVTTVSDIESLNRGYYKWDSYNSVLLTNAFDNPNSYYKTDYDTSYIGFFGFGSDNPQKEYETILDIFDEKLRKLEQLVDQTDLLQSTVSVVTPQTNSLNKIVDKTKVFIVHGHADLAKVSVARTIEQFGLKAIILHEQANGGKTVIEKFESNSADVGFAVVILTNDDDGKAKAETEYKARSRQNVILELGYFIGKLGREKVVPLYEEGVELPSDLAGIVYTPLDNGGAWKYQLGKELKNAGYDVDLNKI